jgi:hypothetical protein
MGRYDTIYLEVYGIVLCMGTTYIGALRKEVVEGR